MSYGTNHFYEEYVLLDLYELINNRFKKVEHTDRRCSGERMYRSAYAFKNTEEVTKMCSDFRNKIREKLFNEITKDEDTDLKTIVWRQIPTIQILKCNYKLGNKNFDDGREYTQEEIEELNSWFRVKLTARCYIK